MVANFAAGGAAINQLARLAGAELRVMPGGAGAARARLHQAPGDERGRAALRAIDDRASAAVPDDVDLLAVGEMGIANTTPAAAIAAALAGEAAAAGPGPAPGSTPGRASQGGGDRRGLDRHRAAMTDPLEVLRHVGGREHAAMLGAILAAPAAAACRCCSTASPPPCRRPCCRRSSRRRRPLPGRPLLGRARPSAAAGADRAAAAARPRHAARRGLGRRAWRSSSSRAAVACHTGMATFASAKVEPAGPDPGRPVSLPVAGRAAAG